MLSRVLKISKLGGLICVVGILLLSGSAAFGATLITSSDDMRRITSQIDDLIAPFTMKDVRDGFENEPYLWNQLKGVSVGAGTIVTLTMTKARQAGGKVSVEVGLRGRNIEVIWFKLLPDRAGFQDIWDARPVVVLSKRISSNASNDIGFEQIEIRQGDATIQYELPGLSCADKCTSQYNKGELKAGITIEDCIKATCN